MSQALTNLHVLFYSLIILYATIRCEDDTCSNEDNIVNCDSLQLQGGNIELEGTKCKIDTNIYEIKAQIGEGYFARVYKAILLNTNQTVAIKLQFDVNSEHTLREIEALRNIKDKLKNNAGSVEKKYNYAELIDYGSQKTSTIHCIVAVFNYYKNGDMPSFLGEFIVNTDKQQKELFAIQSTLKYLDQISVLLEKLNDDLGLTHCDVKDENVLIDFNETTKEINFYLCDFALIHPINEYHPCGAAMFWPKEMYDFHINDYDEKYLKSKQDTLDIVGLNAVAIMWYAKICDNDTLIVMNDDNNNKQYIEKDGINELCINSKYILQQYDVMMSDGLQWPDVEKMMQIRQYMMMTAVSNIRKLYENSIEFKMAQLFSNHVNTFKKKKWKTFRQQLLKIKQ